MREASMMIFMLVSFGLCQRWAVVLTSVCRSTFLIRNCKERKKTEVFLTVLSFTTICKCCSDGTDGHVGGDIHISATANDYNDGDEGPTALKECKSTCNCSEWWERNGKDRIGNIE